MRRFTLLIIVALLSLAAPSFGASNLDESVMVLTEVATDTPVNATVKNQSRKTAYLIVKTENETATASMVVTIFAVNTLGNTLICTTAAITTDTTTTFLLGSLAAGSQEGIGTACDYTLPREILFTFTTTGVGADFDTTARLEWLQ